MIDSTGMPENCCQPVPQEPTAHLPLVPLAAGVKAKPNNAKSLARDLRTLVMFVDTYCAGKHGEVARPAMMTLDVPRIAGRPVFLCAECTKLLAHALVKRTHCPRDPKPECKHCPTHCYAPKYRAEIREVMKFAGTQLLQKGRIDYLLHLFF
jgi:hypothetical protein